MQFLWSCLEVNSFIMKKVISAVCAFMFASMFLGGDVQGDSFDVFIPIAKYIRAGDAEKLSAWFADNLEITIFSETNDSSRKQAKQIMKNFFDRYTPRSFEITHKAGQGKVKYAIGLLNAGGETFAVTIFVSLKGSSYRIQQLRIVKTE